MKTLKVQCFSAVFLLMGFLFAIRAHAQMTPTGDAYTNSATPTTNYGAKPLIDVDAASQISYIQFDLASIPPGASVSQATLKLYVNSVATAGSFNVDYVNGSWSEGTIDYSNAPPLGASIASGVEVTTAEKNHYLLINITPALVAWLDGSQTNDGIALVANGSFNATFDSKENTTTSHPPGSCGPVRSARHCPQEQERQSAPHPFKLRSAGRVQDADRAVPEWGRPRIHQLQGRKARGLQTLVQSGRGESRPRGFHLVLPAAYVRQPAGNGRC